MLNKVRYTGFGAVELSLVWLQPLAAPTIIVAWGPRRISEAMSTTYDTDMFEPLAIGNCTLNAEVSDERKTRNSSGGTGESDSAWRESMRLKVSPPSTIVAMMYQRARGGRSRSKTRKVYQLLLVPLPGWRLGQRHETT